MDTIFAHFIAREDDGKKRLAYASWFIDTIPIVEFGGDELLFWKYLEYCSNLGAIVKSKYFDIWLSSELRTVLRSTGARVPGCEALNYDDPVSFETAVRTTTDVLTDDFRILESVPSEEEDFKVEIAAYLSKRRGERLTQVLSETYNILNTSDSSEEAASYALDQINIVEEVYSADNLEDLDVVDTNKQQLELVSDTGLPAIDKDSGGLFTSQLVGVEAQPGTGKTRFTLGTYIYRAATIYKKNCLFLALEQTPAEIEAMLLALHVFYLFNVQLSDKMITSNTVPPEYQSNVEAARIDLFKSGKYGKIVFLEVDLYVETFITKLRNWDRLQGPFHIIAIDYMGLIDSKPAQYKRELQQAEIITSAFKQFKRYLRRNKKAGIAVSQFNRDGIKAGLADKEISTDMAQGGIAVYRNTDYNIAMSMTETMKLQQKRRFSQPKVRASAGFGTFIADTRLGFCYFKQVAQKSV